MPQSLRREEGERSFARLGETSRPLFEATIATYQDLCPAGYPVIDDNRIPGPGGAIGLRFSARHAFFFALERVKRKTKKQVEAEGLAGALGLNLKKRLPGEPLPPPDPDEPVRLAMLALRWDEVNGWSELHRPLDPRWDEALLREHLAAFLVGFGYDATVALSVEPLETHGHGEPDEPDQAAPAASAVGAADASHAGQRWTQRTA